jgi:Fe-S-cluster containining protein
LDHIHSEEDVEKLKNVYFNEKINCIFLDKDRSCSIYDSRFIACMTYRSYGNRKDCFNSLNYNNYITNNNIEKELHK